MLEKGGIHVGPPQGLCFHPFSPNASVTLGLRGGVCWDRVFPPYSLACSVPGLPWPVHTEPSTVLLSSMGTLSIKQEKTRYPLCISRGAYKVRAGWLPTAPALPELSGWMPFTGGCSTSLHSACFAFQAGELFKAQLRLPQYLQFWCEPSFLQRCCD